MYKQEICKYICVVVILCSIDWMLGECNVVLLREDWDYYTQQQQLAPDPPHATPTSDATAAAAAAASTLPYLPPDMPLSGPAFL